MRGTHGLTGLPWILGGPEDAPSSTIDATDMMGGRVIRAIAAATLKIGDVVFWSASRKVDKTPTATTNHYKVAGVVVSGKNFHNEVPHDASIVGSTAALVDEEVIVCFSGVCFVVADAAIAAGVPIAPSTTVAGRVRPATALAAAAAGLGTLAVAAAELSIAAGATPVTSTAANGTIISVAGDGLTGALAAAALSGDLLDVKIGRIIEAATDAADVRLALINV